MYNGVVVATGLWPIMAVSYFLSQPFDRNAAKNDGVYIVRLSVHYLYHLSVGVTWDQEPVPAWILVIMDHEFPTVYCAFRVTWFSFVSAVSWINVSLLTTVVSLVCPHSACFNYGVVQNAERRYSAPENRLTKKNKNKYSVAFRLAFRLCRFCLSPVNSPLFRFRLIPFCIVLPFVCVI